MHVVIMLSRLFKNTQLWLRHVTLQCIHNVGRWSSKLNVYIWLVCSDMLLAPVSLAQSGYTDNGNIRGTFPENLPQLQYS